MLSTIFSSVEKNCLKFQRILFGRRPFWTWSKLSEALAVNPSFSQVFAKEFPNFISGENQFIFDGAHKLNVVFNNPESQQKSNT